MIFEVNKLITELMIVKISWVDYLKLLDTRYPCLKYSNILSIK